MKATIKKIYPIEGRHDFFKYVIMKNDEIQRGQDGLMYFDQFDKERAEKVCLAINRVEIINNSVPQDEFLAMVKDEVLHDLAEKLIENGFNLIHHSGSNDFNGKDSGVTYFSYSKDGYIGYVQRDRFEGYSLSSSYIPTRGHGSGRGYGTTWEPTVKACDMAMKAGINEYNGPKKWKDLETYLFSAWRVVLVMTDNYK